MCGVEYQQLAFPPTISEKDLIEVALAWRIKKSTIHICIGYRGFKHWFKCSWSYSSATFTPSYVWKQVGNLSLHLTDMILQDLQFCSSWQRCGRVYRGLPREVGPGIWSFLNSWRNDWDGDLMNLGWEWTCTVYSSGRARDSKTSHFLCKWQWPWALLERQEGCCSG